MQLATAIHLIKKGIPKSDKPQRWCDLGAGSGLFTRALGSLLPMHSSIVAVDQNKPSLHSISWNSNDIVLSTYVGDFTSLDWGKNFDGILMANALHYVREQMDFLKGIRAKLSPPGIVLIVEYERRRPNPWVPYPIDFQKLTTIAEESGFSSVAKLDDVPSVYDDVMIYSALLKKGS